MGGAGVARKAAGRAPGGIRGPLVLIALSWGIVLTAFILRPGATSTGPVLEEIRASLSMGPVGAAVLAALPGMSFAAAGAVAAGLGHRIGAAAGLVVCGLLSGTGLLARTAVSSSPTFLVLTFAGLFGAGIGNVLLPVAIKQRQPLHSETWTAVYITVMSLGSVAPQLIAPLYVDAGLGWRPGLALWGWAGLAAALPWTLLALLHARPRRASRASRASRLSRARPPGADASDSTTGEGARAGAAGPEGPWEESPREERTDPAGARADRTAVGLALIARSPRGRAMAAFFGLQSMQAYVAFGWLPQIYRDAGMSQAAASHLLAVFSACGLAGGFIVPILAARSRHLGRWVICFATLLVVTYGGLLAAPTTTAWLWPALLGISGFCFQVALVLVTARTRDYRVTAALSGFTQAVGYALASLGPFVVGWVYGFTGGWTAPLLLLMASAVPMGVFGWRSCAPGLVDDEVLPG